MKVLIIEDNPRMADAISRGLAGENIMSKVCTSGRDGEDEGATGEFDVIILDVMLADHDGLAIARNLRRRKITTPILMLTALSGTDDKVAGLDAGADDYLIKPFEFGELSARLRALTRRRTDFDNAELKYADLEIDLPRRLAKRAGQVIELTNKQFQLLEFMLRNREKVLTREVLGTNVWDMNFDIWSNVIDVHISALRKRVDKPFEKPLIHTVIGVGYMFSADPPPGAARRAEAEADIA